MTGPGSSPGRRPSAAALGGARTQVTAGNVAARVTGLVRVLAVGAALGTTFLGNTYQTANVVSNLMFEVLAAGVLSSVLVPTFVGLLDRGLREEAEGLAGAVLGVALVGLGVVCAVGLLGRTWIMRALTSAVDDPGIREAEVRLGAFWLWFFLPQLLVYAVGAVATALLHAGRRFAAAAFAPVANNLLVIATMVAFVAVRGTSRGPALSLPLGARLVLAAGTTLGVVAMAAIPAVALRRAGVRLRPRWAPGHPGLRRVGRAGLWGGAALAAAQVLVATTLVLANRVEGGVVAYHIAFTAFLLPFAVIAHPVLTTLYPRLAADAASRSWDRFGRALAGGVRSVVFWVLPASALVAALGEPGLRLVGVGGLREEGAALVGPALAAYAAGLVGYALVHLFTRAAYAAGDMAGPALVALGVAVGGSALMVVLSAAGSDRARMVALGAGHSVAMVGGAVALGVRIRRRVGVAMPILGPLARSMAGALAGGGAAAAVAGTVPGPGRMAAAVGLVAGGAAGVAVWALTCWALRAPELTGAARSRVTEAPA